MHFTLYVSHPACINNDSVYIFWYYSEDLLQY